MNIDTRLVVYLIWGLGTVVVYGLVLRRARRRMRTHRDRRSRREFIADFARFLVSLASSLSSTSWEVSSAEHLDIEKALELQDRFHEQRAAHGLPLKEALQAVYSSFLDQTFTMQIGLLLVRLEQPFAISRLRDVSGRRPLAA